MGTHLNQRRLTCFIFYFFLFFWSGNSGYPVGHTCLGNTGAEEQMYRVQYEDFGLVHSRVVLHVRCPGEDIQ